MAALFLWHNHIYVRQGVNTWLLSQRRAVNFAPSQLTVATSAVFCSAAKAWSAKQRQTSALSISLDASEHPALLPAHGAGAGMCPPGAMQQLEPLAPCRPDLVLAATDLRAGCDQLAGQIQPARRILPAPI